MTSSSCSIKVDDKVKAFSEFILNTQFQLQKNKGKVNVQTGLKSHMQALLIANPHSNQVVIFFRFGVQ